MYILWHLDWFLTYQNWTILVYSVIKGNSSASLQHVFCWSKSNIETLNIFTLRYDWRIGNDADETVLTACTKFHRTPKKAFSHQSIHRHHDPFRFWHRCETASLHKRHFRQNWRPIISFFIYYYMISISIVYFWDEHTVSLLFWNVCQHTNAQWRTFITKKKP